MPFPRLHGLPASVAAITKRREVEKKQKKIHQAGDRALSNMRRRAYDSFLVTSGAKEHDLLSKDELNFIQAAEIGDLPTVKQMLENDDLAPKLLRCTDYKDRTALEVSTENEHLEIVEFLVQKGGRKLDIQAIQESLMLAISKGYLRITQALLNHPVHQQSKDKFRLGSLTNYYQRKNNSKFAQDVTPLMLAAHCNEIDIIRLLLNRGDTIKKPHNSLCQCTYCSNKKQFDPLKHSLAGFNTYRALASPAFIALTSPDPILTAFLLSQELGTNARIEKEFKNEYRDLARQCKEFASDLLDMCQNSEEVRTILNNEANTLDESEHERATNWLKSEVGEEGSSRTPTLSRLKLAIKLRQKQFVAHSHCQHELATLWYSNFPSWRLMSLPKKVFVNVLIVLGLPFFTLCYYLAPYSKLGEFVSSPLVKFILYSASYFVFLLVIFVESLYAQTYKNSFHDEKEGKLTSLLRERVNTTTDTCLSIFPGLEDEQYVIRLRFFALTPLEIVILIFLMGFLWGEIKQLWAEGLQAYLASIWNWIDIAMLNLYLASCTLNVLSVTRASLAIDFFMTNVNAPCLYKNGNDPVANTHFYFLQRERSMWHNDDPVFVSEALYALANVLSFCRLSYILPVSEFLGPLQISLGRMLGDILRFAVVFIVVFLAFFCSMFNLYYSYEDSKFGNFGQAFLTLFWALFGLGNPADPRLRHNITSNGTLVAGGKGGYLITESFGTMLYMIYYVVMGLVMLNMLIAMMSNSFQEINSEQDVEWKFARAQLWMSYFEKGATIPVPFNIIPSPKSFMHLYKWVARRVTRFRQGSPSRDNNQVPLGERRNGVFNILNRLELRREESTHESITKGIIKRYLFKLQRDKENDEVNEGELDEIKNDISSLRFELMEQLRTPKTPGPPIAQSSAPAFTFSFPSAAASTKTPKDSDISLEINALKTKITELTRHIETLTNVTLSRQVVAHNNSSRSVYERAGFTDLDMHRGSSNSLRTMDNECSKLECDLQGRRDSSPRVRDVGDIALSYDDSERQQGVLVRHPDRSGRRMSADGGDIRRESLQRAYDVTDIIGYGDHEKQQYNNNNPRPGYGNRDHTAVNRRQSKPSQGGRSGMSNEPDKRSISRTLSRGSIHVGFDLETRHDPVLRVVDEDTARMDFEPDTSSSHNVHHRAPDLSGAGQSRDFESSEGMRGGEEGGVPYDFDEHRADGVFRRGVGNGNSRARYTQEQDALGMSMGHYNIAFSLDT